MTPADLAADNARRNARGFDLAVDRLAGILDLDADSIWDRLAVPLSQEGTTLESAFADVLVDLGVTR